MNQTKPIEIQNLFTLMDVVSAPDVVAKFDEDYNKCAIRYGDLKKQLAEDIILFTEPMREKIKSIISDDAYIKKVVEMGREKAKASASKTISEVRDILGIKKF